MAMQINEQKMIEDNVFLYEQKLKTPIRRFIDKNFTPCRYWHIDTEKTTVDAGYGDVAAILGKDSPIKYKRIDNFPIYGLSEILIQLQDTDQGLDGEYSGEGVIMAGTIEPLQNDFFMINYLKEAFIFRISGVEYDNISSAPCYKISFVLEYIDTEKEEELEDQTKSEFTCIIENIGTEERCIIEKESFEKVRKIEQMYDEIVHTFLTFYYSDRYNSLLGDLDNGLKLFDPLQVDFINKHQLFLKKNQIDSLILTEQFKDSRRKIKYEKSIYRFIEKRDARLVQTFDYVIFPGTNNPETGFYQWLDKSVMILDIPKVMDPENHYQILTDTFVEAIRLYADTNSSVGDMIVQFIRDPEMSIYDIPMDLDEKIMFLDEANLEVFIFTPIILYIIKTLISDFLKKEMKG